MDSVHELKEIYLELLPSLGSDSSNSYVPSSVSTLVDAASLHSLPPPTPLGFGLPDDIIFVENDLGEDAIVKLKKPKRPSKWSERKVKDSIQPMALDLCLRSSKTAHAGPNALPSTGDDDHDQDRSDRTAHTDAAPIPALSDTHSDAGSISISPSQIKHARVAALPPEEDIEDAREVASMHDGLVCDLRLTPYVANPGR